MAGKGKGNSRNKKDIKFLTAPKIGNNTKKYCRFKKMGMRHVDYKDPEFLLKFLNEQGKILPRRLSGNSLKFQRKVATSIKRARHLAILPYVTDLLK